MIRISSVARKQRIFVEGPRVVRFFFAKWFSESEVPTNRNAVAVRRPSVFAFSPLSLVSNLFGSVRFGALF